VYLVYELPAACTSVVPTAMNSLQLVLQLYQQVCSWIVLQFVLTALQAFRQRMLCDFNIQFYTSYY